MNQHTVTIYTSKNCSECEKLREKLSSWGIKYTEKNITNNMGNLKELQNKGIYGTPATFIDDQPILGLQENKLKYELGIGNSNVSYFRDFYEGYETNNR